MTSQAGSKLSATNAHERRLCASAEVATLRQVARIVWKIGVCQSPVGLTTGVKLRAHQARQDSYIRNDRCLGAKRSRQRAIAQQVTCPSASMSELDSVL